MAVPIPIKDPMIISPQAHKRNILCVSSLVFAMKRTKAIHSSASTASAVTMGSGWSSYGIVRERWLAVRHFGLFAFPEFPANLLIRITP